MVRTKINSPFSKLNDEPVIVVVDSALDDEENIDDDDKDLVGAFEQRLGLQSQDHEIFGSILKSLPYKSFLAIPSNRLASPLFFSIKMSFPFSRYLCLPMSTLWD
ncbi:hypothetical protein U1Q18_033924 [Sarracenia purpurea var. burkii]